MGARGDQDRQTSHTHTHLYFVGRNSQTRDEETDPHSHPKELAGLQ